MHAATRELGGIHQPSGLDLPKGMKMFFKVFSNKANKAKKLFCFVSDRRAVTALEYGILAGVLGLVLITIFQGFGSTLTKLFHTIGSSV